jgi:endogenous inhibitor of DNA gyrase (YacG/DUF329 family)
MAGVSAPDRAPSLRCPRCGTSVIWQSNPHRPFCSLTCRLIDLGRWLDERYRIPAAEESGDAGGNDGGWRDRE